MSIELKEEWQNKIEMQIVSFPQEGLNKEILEMMEESLKMGADLLGGLPADSENPKQHINKLFELARKYNVSRATIGRDLS